MVTATLLKELQFQLFAIQSEIYSDNCANFQLKFHSTRSASAFVFQRSALSGYHTYKNTLSYQIYYKKILDIKSKKKKEKKGEKEHIRTTQSSGLDRTNCHAKK
jgi:hypothetical protein